MARGVTGVFEMVWGGDRPELQKVAAAGPNTPVPKIVAGRRRRYSMAVGSAKPRIIQISEKSLV